MSYSPVKFLAGCVVEVGGFALLLCCLPMLSEQASRETAEPRAVLGVPQIIATPQVDFQGDLSPRIGSLPEAPPYAAASATPTITAAEREQYVARTLDTAGQRLASAVGAYLHDAATEVLAPATSHPNRLAP